MVENTEEWATLSSALGEALLDVERTFLDVVDRQTSKGSAAPFFAAGSPVQAYLEAWSRLDGAHRVLVARFLVAQVGHPVP